MSSPVANGRVFTESREQAETPRPLITSGDAHDLVEPVKQLIIQYPTAALASAFLVGVALAWWIKRR